MKRIKKKVLLFKRTVWVFTLLWMGIIYYFSSQPAEVSLKASGKVLVKLDQVEEEEAQNISDRKVWNLQYYIRKFAHFIIYSGLGFLMVLSLVLIKYQRWISYVLAWLAASFYGVLDELHQGLVPGRGTTWADIRLDGLSALAGVLLALVVVELWRKRMKLYRSKLLT